MGRGGPPPTPTPILKLRGTRRGRQRKPEPEPVPMEPGTPPPEWLDDRAATEWRRVVPELERLKLLTRIDVSALAIYCQEVSRYQEAVRHIRKEGQVYYTRGKDGEDNLMRQSAWVQIAQTSANIVRQYMHEFGLSPAARVGLPAKKDHADDGKAAQRFVRLA